MPSGRLDGAIAPGPSEASCRRPGSQRVTTARIGHRLMYKLAGATGALTFSNATASTNTTGRFYCAVGGCLAFARKS